MSAADAVARGRPGAVRCLRRGRPANQAGLPQPGDRNRPRCREAPRARLRRRQARVDAAAPHQHFAMLHKPCGGSSTRSCRLGSRCDRSCPERARRFAQLMGHARRCKGGLCNAPARCSRLATFLKDDRLTGGSRRGPRRGARINLGPAFRRSRCNQGHQEPRLAQRYLGCDRT